MKVRIEDIKLGKNHSRDTGVGDVSELVESLKRHGQLEAVKITPEYVLAAGYRRMAAATQLGWETIKADVTHLSPELVNIIENMNRKDLSLWDEIMAIRNVFGETPCYADVCRETSKSRTWVKPRVDVWTLPSEFLEEIRLGRVDIGQVRRRLRHKRGPSQVSKNLGRPNIQEISDVVTRLIEKGRQSEARALSFAIGTVNREQLLGDE